MRANKFKPVHRHNLKKQIKMITTQTEYFKGIDPIGKKIVYKAGNPQNPPEMTITGVFAPPQ